MALLERLAQPPPRKQMWAALVVVVQLQPRLLALAGLRFLVAAVEVLGVSRQQHPDTIKALLEDNLGPLN